MKTALWIFGIAAVGFVVLLVVANLTAPPRKNLADRIADACHRQFDDQGLEAIQRCQITLATKYLTEDQKERLDDAYAGSR